MLEKIEDEIPGKILGYVPLRIIHDFRQDLLNIVTAGNYQADTMTGYPLDLFFSRTPLLKYHNPKHFTCSQIPASIQPVSIPVYLQKTRR